MNIAVLLIVVISAWKYGDWKNWQRYHLTMLYVATANLLYNLIYCNHLLWQIVPGALGSYVITEVTYSFLVFPLSAFVFLSNLKTSIWKQSLHILKYVVIYTVFEYVFVLSNMIVYKYGWNILWSILWNIMMFILWQIHHKKPLMAYFVSVIVILTVLKLFPLY